MFLNVNHVYKHAFSQAIFSTQVFQILQTFTRGFHYNTHTHTYTHYIWSYIVYFSLNWESPAGNKKKERGKVFSSPTTSVSDYLYKTFLFQCLFGKEGSTQPLQCKEKHQQGLYPQSSMPAMPTPVLSPCLCSIHKLSSMNEME